MKELSAAKRERERKRGTRSLVVNKIMDLAIIQIAVLRANKSIARTTKPFPSVRTNLF